MGIIHIVALLGFLLFCILITWKYKKLRMDGIPVSVKNSRIKTIVMLTFLSLFFFVFTSELVFHSLSISFSLLPNFLQHNIHNFTILKIIGAALIGLSVFSMHFTLSELNKSLRFGLDANNLGKLVTSGIFTYSRNPFFVSVIFQFLGIALVFPTIFFVGISVLSIISIHFFITKEERFMRKNYGQEYENYCKKVRRYF